ncbi:hypothetical protein AOC36_07560 [Erysipelothrix larvae]|uniref:DUF4310 family protein n=1 Tax=Erysipelothrix larvae TaxID=1514105 RepID=A0A0X8H0N6_9FIRM|nr:DUF4310 family protein [Erysipelothrix larvae]AMC93845.1 hypothetical protein AOC36_07560 [Erysipelothrix larvae]
MKEKFEAFLEKDIAFILLLALASAGVVGATSMYLTHGVGLTNEIYIAEFLDQGKSTGAYDAALAFSSAFLIARILEGPLVGILDIGGSLMTGIGVGIPAILLTSNMGFLIDSFILAILSGFVIGGSIGALIILIRKFTPTNSLGTATSIMIGAGNKTGDALGPLVILSAVAYGPFIGIGSVIGSLVFYKIHKPIVGGAILGAIIMAAFNVLVGIPLPVVS